MSDFAIAAVTATLRLLLQTVVAPATVTSLPLDRAAAAGQPNRLNLFLYHTAPNAAWRNQTIPNKVKPGESGQPPLALNLYYLLTAYGDDQADEADHRLLGTAMRVLHDHAVLTSQDIKNATDATLLSQARLNAQFEQVKLSPESLSLEEMSKLWTTFQTQYRISAAYQASVVFIESQRALKSPLPVLKRGGEDDHGVDLIPSMPGVLEGVEYRDLRSQSPAFPAAQLGETVTLVGRQLPGSRCEVLFIDPRHKPTATEPTANVVGRLKPEAKSNDQEIYVQLNPALTTWTSGSLQVLLEDLPAPDQRRRARSNALQFGLAPSLLLNNTMPFVVVTENGRRQLVLNCTPGITQNPVVGQNPDPNDRWPEVMLILTPTTGVAQVKPITLNVNSPSVSPTTPVFDVESVPPGSYRVRVRIETVESLVMVRNGFLLDFDDRQVVTL